MSARSSELERQLEELHAELARTQSVDPKSRELLADEIARRLPLFARALSDPLDVRAALHSLRGAAAMAGYSDLALVITQLGTRVRRPSRRHVR